MQTFAHRVAQAVGVTLDEVRVDCNDDRIEYTIRPVDGVGLVIIVDRDANWTDIERTVRLTLEAIA